MCLCTFDPVCMKLLMSTLDVCLFEIHVYHVNTTEHAAAHQNLFFTQYTVHTVDSEHQHILCIL